MKIIPTLAAALFALGGLATDPLVPEKLAADIKTAE
jgi:hypothetical protein